jgi:3-hydroxyacyl-CoA dehydrogenase/enoyl-CoA hydratase/3-hydroxybutyryl-CoA epimerase
MMPAAASETQARNFRLEVADGVATVLIDEPGEPVNTLSPEVGEEFDRLLTGLGKDPAVKAVVFASGKKDGFIAGAKIEMLQGVKGAADAEKLAREGQAGFDRLERFPKPVVAAVHGACLGGGLEWAMACHYRICSDDPRTQLGQPEVQLGLIPGAGGTQRLPRAVPLAFAMELMLTGERFDAQTALNFGLVSRVVPADQLMATAEGIAAKVLECGPLAVRSIKQAVLRGREMTLEEGLKLESELTGKIFATADAREGPTAFAQKRKPEYKGR